VSGPLHGFRVIELAGLGPGPFAGMVLADAGADVLRIDRPGAGRAVAGGTAGGAEERVAAVDVLGRGKRSVAVDLKRAEGVEVVLRLVAGADVLLEGFRPGVVERLGVGPASCLAANPRLVYGRMTGWGQTGPLAARAGHDIDYIALAGALGPIGPADGLPVTPLNLVGDFGGGGMLLAFGVVAALLETASSGRGQIVDAAMVDGAALLLAMLSGMRAAGVWNDRRGDNLLDGGAPFYRTYETADGRAVAVGALEPQFYGALLEGLGLATEELPAQHDRASWPELEGRFAAVFRERTRDEWAQHFAERDACVAPVLDLGEAAEHPHLAERGTYAELGGVL
jgi:alpha-methylacyl-CoA racemase